MDGSTDLVERREKNGTERSVWNIAVYVNLIIGIHRK